MWCVPRREDVLESFPNEMQLKTTFMAKMRANKKVRLSLEFISPKQVAICMS